MVLDTIKEYPCGSETQLEWYYAAWDRKEPEGLGVLILTYRWKR